MSAPIFSSAAPTVLSATSAAGTSLPRTERVTATFMRRSLSDRNAPAAIPEFADRPERDQGDVRRGRRVQGRTPRFFAKEKPRHAIAPRRANREHGEQRPTRDHRQRERVHRERLADVPVKYEQRRARHPAPWAWPMKH